jgi:hypothetical protein
MLIWYFHHRVAELVGMSGADSILDVGCGEWFTMDRLLSVDGHLPIKGVDYDFPALRQSRGEASRDLLPDGRHQETSFRR